MMGFDNTNGLNRVEKSNALIDGRNFYDQPISDKIRKYDEK